MTSYLHWIRQRVGRQKILLVFASACIRDDDGRLLWQRRADFGWWGLPGGVLELDESLPQCVAREAREETGLQVEPRRLVGVYSSPDFDVTCPNGDQVQQVTFCFECRVTAGRLQTDNSETLDLAWFAPDNLPPTAPWYRAMAADLCLEKRSTFRRGRPGNGREGEPFYKQIRRHIGKSSFTSPGAAAFIQDERGRVLLQRRSDTGEWGIPAGAMELGERIDQTVISEVYEETGLEIEPTRLIGVYSDPDFWHTYPNGDKIKIVSALFGARVTGGELRADGVESLEVRFFPPDALPPLAERHLRYLRRVLDGLAGREETFF